MNLAGSPLLSIILAMAAVFLALSVVIQIVQEIYKYLTKSKSRMYTNLLFDTLGPWAGQLLSAVGGGALMDLQVRGPLQFWRSRPRGLLLPLDHETLLAGLERTAPALVRRALDRLTFEAQVQAGHPQPPSATWLGFLDELRKVEKGSPGYLSAQKIARFLTTWDHQWIGEPKSAEPTESGKPQSVGEIRISKAEPFPAARLVVAFRREFLPHVEDTKNQLPQLERNFEYAYRRRNLRQTFVIGFVFAVLFNLPLERIYQRANSLSPAEAAAIALQAMEAYDRGMVATDTSATPDLEQVKAILQKTVLDTTRYQASANYLMDFREVGRLWDAGFFTMLRFLFGCFLSALLVSFGAPFWNDLASALLRIRQSRKGAPAAVEEGEHT